MGLLQNGRWVNQWYDTKESGGEFRRQDSRFRSWIGDDEFPAERDRYHLYVSLACPWAHRTLIFRNLKQLEDVIGVTVVEPLMLDNGWEVKDSLYGFDYVYQLYLKSDESYEGRVTVPILWDKHSETIVSNESEDIVRMMNTAFNSLTGLRTMINEVNERIYLTVNNGVYKCGFATSQLAYEKAYGELFESLDWIEGILSRQRHLVGDSTTEADWRLFTTLIRFDAVYHGHFKCNRQKLSEYPNISNYLRELYQCEGVAETVDFFHIKQHYYGSHATINPSGVVPLGPKEDFMLAHNRI
ncbi:MAG: putative glutathione S-transferase [Candidatus Azotimanducaceae bacterium]|jgi:putative glutathione S-transferase